MHELKNYKKRLNEAEKFTQDLEQKLLDNLAERNQQQQHATTEEEFQDVLSEKSKLTQELEGLKAEAAAVSTEKLAELQKQNADMIDEKAELEMDLRQRDAEIDEYVEEIVCTPCCSYINFSGP